MSYGCAPWSNIKLASIEAHTSAIALAIESLKSPLVQTGSGPERGSRGGEVADTAAGQHCRHCAVRDNLRLGTAAAPVRTGHSDV
jgi:hypothetical protein